MEMLRLLLYLVSYKNHCGAASALPVFHKEITVRISVLCLENLKLGSSLC